MIYKVTFYNGNVIEDRTFTDKYSALVFISQQYKAGHSATLYTKDGDKWHEVCVDSLDETIATGEKRVICG